MNLAPYVNSIKTGHVTAKLAGWLGGSGTWTDEAFVELDFKNSKGFLVGSWMTLGPVTESDRGGKTELVEQSDSATVPKSARSASYSSASAVKPGRRTTTPSPTTSG